jgi:Concanavalin A-like lectin/glucanases superfamily
MRVPLTLLILLAAQMISSCSRQAEKGAGIDPEALKAIAKCGAGFVVWERRSDDGWQIWTKPISGGPEELLVHDEDGFDHCCPKISPNGRQLAYLSLKQRVKDYDDSPGTLWLMDLATRKQERLVEGARTYHENRAVVWFDEGHLCYVEATGDATELDLATRTKVKLTSKSHPRGGWLVDRTKHHATTGEPEFAPFDATSGELHSMPKQGGCQPYFSADGRWGYWMGGAGGPVNAMFLPTRQISPMLELNDPRLSTKSAYVYFPMLADNMQLLAFGASNNVHDHFVADYDLFLVRMDPVTLDAIGKAVRLTAEPATDRYPDVWQEKLPLGSHFLEGPSDVTLQTPDKTSAQWFIDDKPEGEAPLLTHHFTKTGDHWIEARSYKGTLTGLVHLRRPTPPYVTLIRRKQPDRLTLTFSEAVTLESARAASEDGKPLSLSPLTGEGRICDVLIDNGVKEISLSGVKDLAQQPNVMKPERLSVPSLGWPQSREGLVFAWDNKATPSIGLPDAAPERTGKAFWNASGGLDVRGGSVVIPGAGEAITSACAKSGALTIEAVIRPLVPPYDRQARPILAIESEQGDIQLLLSQSMSQLMLRVPTTDDAKHQLPDHMLAQVRSGSTYHIIISYEKGRLSMFLNGIEVWVRPIASGPLAMTAGKNILRIGASKAARENWPGTVEHLAFYSRSLTPSEALGHSDLMATMSAERAKLRQHKVRVKLISASRIPTLQEIAPYREALMTCLYEVLPLDEEKDKLEVPAGTRLTVTHWVWVNGERAHEIDLTPGAVSELWVDPLSQHTEVKGLVNRNDLTDAIGLDEYLDASNW